MRRPYASSICSIFTLCMESNVKEKIYESTSILAVIKFSYSSFVVCLSDVSWRVSNLLLTVTAYWLLISVLTYRHIVNRGCFFIYFCVDSSQSLLGQFCDWKILFQKSSKHYLSTSCLWLYNLAVLYSYLDRLMAIVFPSFFGI